MSGFEDKLSDAWPRCLDRDEAAFRATTALYRLIQKGVEEADAQVALIDVGPNLGAMNRAAIIAAQHIVIPLAPDLYSLQGLRNLGPTLRRWREQWTERLEKRPNDDGLSLPEAAMTPRGYVVMQHDVRSDRPVNAYAKWMNRIPGEYRESVLRKPPPGEKFRNVLDDPHCLSHLKHFRSLMPMAMEARKPMFFLKPADGAIGSHTYAVKSCYDDFQNLAKEIASRCGIPLP